MVAAEDEPMGPDREAAQVDLARLLGSRDPDNGEVHFPPRRYGVDGRCFVQILESTDRAAR